MRKNYVKHFFEERKDIKDIAKLYNLSTTTVYTSLDIISKETGIAREDLLRRPHTEHSTYIREYKPIEEVDPSCIQNLFDDLLKGIEETLVEVRKTVDRLEQLDKESADEA